MFWLPSEEFSVVGLGKQRAQVKSEGSPAPEDGNAENGSLASLYPNSIRPCSAKYAGAEQLFPPKGNGQGWKIQQAL